MKQKDENMTKEMCYKRLEHLLNRSNFYTQFLLERMNEQQQQKESKHKSQLAKESNSSVVKVIHFGFLSSV